MAKRWKYSGDLNLECGGFFYQESGYDDHVYAVQVTPCSDAGGPDNLYCVETGSIYIPIDKPETIQSALNTIGETLETASRDDIIYAMNCYHGIERDIEHYVRIGPVSDFYEENGSGWNPEPNHVLRSNAKLKNYIRKEFL